MTPHSDKTSIAPLDKKWVERILRITISTLDMRIQALNSLPETDYNVSIHRARHHMREAQNHLREWAKANEVTILDRMPT